MFLNPPYGKTAGKSRQGIWAWRLIECYLRGAIHSAILLVKPCVSERWFQPLWDFPVCFTDHRIQFIASQSGQKGNGATQGGAFVYLGNDPERFASVFRRFGHVILPLRLQAQAMRTCAVCGNAFFTTRPKAKTCSARCKQKAYRQRVTAKRNTPTVTPVVRQTLPQMGNASVGGISTVERFDCC